MKAYLNKKTVVLSFVLLILVVLLVSCKAEEKDHLAYQEYPIKAECVLSVRGEEYPVILDVTGPDSARITFVGSRLEGGMIELSGNTALFIKDEYSIPLELSRDSALSALLSAFALSSSSMTEVTETGDALVVSYRTDEFSVKVTLCDGFPSAMEFTAADGIYGLAVNNFTSGS